MANFRRFKSGHSLVEVAALGMVRGHNTHDGISGTIKHCFEKENIIRISKVQIMFLGSRLRFLNAKASLGCRLQLGASCSQWVGRGGRSRIGPKSNPIAGNTLL